MTIEKIFYLYMAVVGIAVGAILVAAPQAGEFFIKPYFWVLIAVGLFEIGTSLYRLQAPGPVMTMQARVIGFGIGIVGMVAFPTIAGAPVKFI